MNLSDLPEPIRDSLEGQSPEFIAEMVERWRVADEETRADILAFHESEGPRKVHEAKLKHEDGTPTSSDLEDALGSDEQGVAIMAPSPVELDLDGVKCRAWGGVTAQGAPFRPAVHRVLMEPQHEAAVLSAFPILVPKAQPNSLEVTAPGREPIRVVRADYQGPCLTKLRKLLSEIDRHLCREIVQSPDGKPLRSSSVSPQPSSAISRAAFAAWTSSVTTCPCEKCKKPEAQKNPDDDDEHEGGELAWAAVCYASVARPRSSPRRSTSSLYRLPLEGGRRARRRLRPSRGRGRSPRRPQRASSRWSRSISAAMSAPRRKGSRGPERSHEVGPREHDESEGRRGPDRGRAPSADRGRGLPGGSPRAACRTRDRRAMDCRVSCRTVGDGRRENERLRRPRGRLQAPRLDSRPSLHEIANAIRQRTADRKPPRTSTSKPLLRKRPLTRVRAGADYAPATPSRRQWIHGRTWLRTRPIRLVEERLPKLEASSQALSVSRFEKSDVREYHYLLGADDVKSAGHNMQDAASEMTQAASNLQFTLESHQCFLDDWLARFTAALESSRKSEASS